MYDGRARALRGQRPAIIALKALKPVFGKAGSTVSDGNNILWVQHVTPNPRVTNFHAGLIPDFSNSHSFFPGNGTHFIFQNFRIPWTLHDITANGVIQNCHPLSLQGQKSL